MSEQYIKYEPQLHVMLCRLCKEGITKNGIAWHYREHHKDIPLQERKGLVKYCNNFDVYTMKEFQYPKTIISCIEDRMIEQGFRCLFNDCNYACKYPTSMEEHCKTKHGWVSAKGITLKHILLTLYPGIMWMEHDVQSIFKGPSSPYFPVRTAPLLDEPEIDDFVRQALEAADLNDVEESRRKNIIVPETQSERITPWINRAGFLRILAGKTITELYPLTSARVDMETEPELEHIQRSVPTLIAQCLEGVRDLEKRGWEVILFWLNSTKIGTMIDQPFQLYYDPHTVPRYSELWLRFILFTLRTFELNPGDNDVKYTTAQSQALYDLKELIWG